MGEIPLFFLLSVHNYCPSYIAMLEIMKNIHYYMFILCNALPSYRMFWSLAELVLIYKEINLMDVGYFKCLIKFFILFHTCISLTEVVKNEKVK